MIFLALKTEDGRITGKISFYCRMLGVSRQGFYKYLANKDRPWKHQNLADAMKEIINEDECNDTYGRIRMYQALLLKQPEGVHIPSERTVYRVMDQIGLSHRPKRKPNGLTKADREAMKSDDLLKRDFHSDVPLEKCITDITEIPASNGKLYVSAIFDCFDLSVLGLAMENKHESRFVYPNTGKRPGCLSHAGRRCYPQRPWGTVYQRSLSSSYPEISYPPKHEQRGRALP